MSAPRAPKYCLHKRNGTARVVVRDHTGQRREVFLPGRFDSLESRQAYERLLLELRINGGRMAPPRMEDALPIAELILAYLEHKQPDAIGGEGECQKLALLPLERLFGATLAKDFDSRALKTLQRTMADGSWLSDDEAAKRRKNGKAIGWSRSFVNRCISRIRSLFKWAVLEKMVPPAILVELQAVPPVKMGRARETELVTPVDPEIVEKTLPKLPPLVRDMVRLQLFTGARPGEVCIMRPCDIDRTGPVWIYTPSTHKNAHRGHVRKVAIGPKGQRILEPHLAKVEFAAFVFSPARQIVEIQGAKRAARKTKVQPSQLDRRKPTAKRRPQERFLPRPYAKAIARAAKAASVPHWHPHQLRHTAALLIEREHGAEAARATLGHRTLNMTLHYSGIDLQRAAEVAANMG